jgi:hypothetical protein
MAAEAPAGPAAAVAGGDDTHMSDHGAGSSSCGQQAWQAGAAAGLALGEPDCELLGPGWSLQAHKQVLKSECLQEMAAAAAGRLWQGNVAGSRCAVLAAGYPCEAGAVVVLWAGCVHVCGWQQQSCSEQTGGSCQTRIYCMLVLLCCCCCRCRPCCPLQGPPELRHAGCTRPPAQGAQHTRHSSRRHAASQQACCSMPTMRLMERS